MNTNNKTNKKKDKQVKVYEDINRRETDGKLGKLIGQRTNICMEGNIDRKIR